MRISTLLISIITTIFPASASATQPDEARKACPLMEVKVVAQGKGELPKILPAGVYVVRSNGQSRKVIIK